MQLNIVDFINSNRETLDSILDLVPIPLFVKDRSGLYIDCNKAFESFFSFDRSKIIGKTVYQIWSKNEADIFFAQDEELFTSGGLQVYETTITSSAGITSIVQFHKQVFTDATGGVAGFLGAMFDITEKKDLENALANQAATDELTGLANRREGMARLEALHFESKCNASSYCLALVDIDNFKKINDIYGHANGDLVLKAFADLVVTSLRRDDICFRYGGEEFIVILPNTNKIEGVKVVERLRKSWSETELILLNGNKICASVSIGLSQNIINEESFEDLIQKSDKALYVAKDAGRNRTICSD